MHKGLVGFAKYSLVIFALVAVSCFAILNMGVVSAVHTSSAELQPEWSAAGQNVDYTVTLCNDVNSADKIDEVRVYKNEDYTDFLADPKTGWYLGSYNPVKGYYPYTATSSEYYIDPDECTDFTFSATVPSQPSDVCDLQWKFETRDVTETWLAIYDTTSIDSNAPTITKQVIGPQQGPCPPGQGEECWVMDHVTEIYIQVSDVSGEECDSGLEYCKYRIILDGIPGGWQDVDLDKGDLEVYFDSIIFDEDSVHILEIECKDVAGNIVEDSETFRVDSTPPETTKVVSDPKKIDGYVEWVDTYTQITFDPVDPDPTGEGCNIGVEETWYKNIVVYGENQMACFEPAAYCNLDYFPIDFVEQEWNLYGGTPITKDDESCHILYYFSVDELGNTEEIKTNCFFVDKTPPESIKEVGDPKLPLCDIPQRPPEFYTETLVLDDDPEAMTVSVTKTLDCEKVIWDFELEEQVCTYGNTEFELYIGDGVNSPKFRIAAGGATITPWPPGSDPVIYEWGDGNGPLNGWYGPYDLYDGIVATNPDGADFVGYGDRVFHVEIPMEHLVGGDYYWALYVGGFSCMGGLNGRVNYPTDWDQIQDWLGNTHGPYVYGGIMDWWVRDHVTPITLDCTDPEPHPSGDEEVCYKVSFDLDPFDLTRDYCDPEDMELIEQEGHEGDWCCVPAPEIIVFEEDSLHDLEYFCRDAVDKKSEIDIEYFKVDSQHPVIEKTVIGPQVGQCDPIVDYNCWIKDWTCGQTDGTTIHVEATDPEINGCAVDLIECEWWYKLDGEPEPMKGGVGLPPSFDIMFYDETEHELHIECCDILGNCYEDVEWFYVDSSGPTVEKEFSEPKHDEEGMYGTIEWIDTATTIELTATDQPDAPCAVGEDKIYYKNTLVDDYYCLEPENSCNPVSQPNPTGDGWTEYLGPFNKLDESCHMLEYYAVDELGNMGPVYANCFFVDHTAPTILKDDGEAIPGTGEPMFITNDNPNGDFHWITQEMPITFTCTDQEPHPSGDEELCFKVSYDYPSWGYITEQYCDTPLNDEGYCCVTGTAQEPFGFYFEEDSMHNLEYYCQDAVEKSSGNHVQYYKVDTEAPSVEKILNLPYYGECPPRPNTKDVCFVDTATTIDLYTEDGGDICHVDGVECKWRYKVAGMEWSDWSSSFPMTFPEECQHTIQLECWDALGNKWTDEEYFYVDKTEPGIWKNYGEGPYFDYDNDYYAEWINKETTIYAGVTDDGPHKSGISEVKYRVTLLDNDEYCREYEVDDYKCEDAVGEEDWTYVDPEDFDGFAFSITEESCHLIEIYAEDNVEKSNLHKQCVFVDNTPPVPDKEVGEPKEEWDGSDARYYDIEDLCWNTDVDPQCSDPEKCLECWKVTLLTPVYLKCVDMGDHPVDNEGVCFKVERDGRYETSKYCGTDLTDGFCCVDHEMVFNFGNTSEHELEYYCYDALGNTNKEDLDIEKFKVEETAFNITLNHKWNLISVPVFLLNDDPEAVFSDIADKVKGVWTYDSEGNWHAWIPGPAGDDLEEIIPGWGYWVLMEDDAVLTIGGSEMRPGPVGQASKEIVPGWNLIGYYGVDGVDPPVYDGPDGEGGMAYCELYNLGEDIWDKGFTALYSYWEPDNPYQWYTHHTDKLGLESTDNMDPGAGYWLGTPQSGIYLKTSSCGLMDLI